MIGHVLTDVLVNRWVLLVEGSGTEKSPSEAEATGERMGHDPSDTSSSEEPASRRSSVANGDDQGNRWSWRSAQVKLVTGVIFVIGPIVVFLINHFGPGTVDLIERRVTGSDAPIEIEVLNDVEALHAEGLGVFPTYVVPGRWRNMAPPPEDGLYDTEWARQTGAVDGNYSQVRLTVRGRTDSPVVLQGLEVEIVERRPPLDGVSVSTEFGDPLGVATLEVDLDETPTRPTYLTDDTGERIGNAFPLSVSNSEVEVIDLSVLADSCDCDWIIRLYYSSDRGGGFVEVDDAGQPFRTTSTSAALPVVFDRGTWIEAERLSKRPIADEDRNVADPSPPTEGSGPQDNVDERSSAEVCLRDSVEDVQPRPLSAGDLVAFCAVTDPGLHLSVEVANGISPLMDERWLGETYITFSYDADGDVPYDYTIVVRREGAELLAESYYSKTGSNPCTGKADWDGRRITVRDLEASCLGSVKAGYMTATLVYDNNDPRAGLYIDDVPDFLSTSDPSTATPQPGLLVERQP